MGDIKEVQTGSYCPKTQSGLWDVAFISVSNDKAVSFKETSMQKVIAKRT